MVVNGHQLPPLDQCNPIADVGSYLESGENTIEVEVATTLNNRLHVSNPDVYEIMPRQEYVVLRFPVEFTSDTSYVSDEIGRKYSISPAIGPLPVDVSRFSLHAHRNRSAPPVRFNRTKKRR